MIRRIHLKFGRAPNLEPEPIEATSVTVFVGPNNSGKSTVLSEIHRYCTSGQRSTRDVIVDRVEFEGFPEEEAKQRVAQVTLKPSRGEAVQPGNILVGKGGVRHQLPKQTLVNALVNPDSQQPYFGQYFLAYNTLILNGQNRISLLKEQVAGDLLSPPTTSFQVLFRDDAKRNEVRRIIHEAFGRYFVIDPTNLGKLRARLSSRPPKDEIEERGIHEGAVTFHNSAEPIESTSDGVRAFAGIITEIIAGDPLVLLIDEPEAFLHPALAFKLGKEISVSSLGSRKRIFVSTHSPMFVMGCIQSGVPVNIVRLTYRDGVATARLLPGGDLLRLMRNPLLRSTGVLSGLFYEFVVVTESDADRAFYEEINERLLRFRPDRGIPNCLFLNAQNKQTVHQIIRPLRQLGIPAAGIVDVDILKEGGTAWSNFVEAGFVPDLERHSLATLRSDVMRRIEATGKDMKREGGIGVLTGTDQEAAANLFDRLSDYGLFVVRSGELESWLRGLQASGHGPNWLVEVFEKMGEDPGAPSYVRPEDGDVWEFIAGIREWLVKPTRKGIPA